MRSSRFGLRHADHDRTERRVTDGIHLPGTFTKAVRGDVDPDELLGTRREVHRVRPSAATPFDDTELAFHLSPPEVCQYACESPEILDSTCRSPALASTR